MGNKSDTGFVVTRPIFTYAHIQSKFSVKIVLNVKHKFVVQHEWHFYPFCNDEANFILIYVFVFFADLVAQRGEKLELLIDKTENLVDSVSFIKEFWPFAILYVFLSS